MGIGMAYAVVSLGFAGVNDVLFRRYGAKTRPVGILLALIGTVWTLLFLALGFHRNTIQMDLATILIGTISGIVSALANILLIEGMKRTGASIAATIYRLNLVFVVVLAFVFLNESMGMFKIAGIMLAVFAVSLFLLPERNIGITANIALKFILLLVLASFLRACMGISYKFASSMGIHDEIFLAVNGFWWMVAGLSYTFLFERKMDFCRSSVKYGLISGVLVCGIVLFLKLSVNYMDASVAVSVSQFSFLVTAPLAACFMKERITFKMGLGMASAALCIILFFISNNGG